MIIDWNVLQVISDAALRIRNLVARWPGSTHDAFMLENSQVKTDFEAGRHHGYWLLGDSGYPCRKYLITPLLRPSNRQEIRFNMAHKRTRSVVERCIGVLKSRFRCVINYIVVYLCYKSSLFVLKPCLTFYCNFSFISLFISLFKLPFVFITHVK